MITNLHKERDEVTLQIVKELKLKRDVEKSLYK